MNMSSLRAEVMPGQLPSAPTTDPAAREPAFGKEQYVALKRQLSFTPSPLHSLVAVAMTALLFAAAVWLVGRGGALAYAGAQLLFAVGFFRAFALLHECGHGSAFGRGWLNTVVGHLASLFCFLPFYPWKLIHQAHHVWAGNLSKDPTLRALRGWRERRGAPALVRFAWRSWIPLAALVQHVVFWSYPLRLAREPGTERAQVLRCALSVGFLGGGYLALWAWQPGLFSLRTFGPALLVYLVVVELVNLPHHIGTPTFDARVPLWEQWRTTRSCYYPVLVSELFVLNFNFHTEHHLFPALPWFRLRAARELIRRSLGSRYPEEIGISWNLSGRGRDFNQLIDESGPGQVTW
jgi:acyl-lipid omega-6 desaturase (Delta-12 desaturase)